LKSIDELDPYELLEIPRRATPAEIDRAYRMAQQTYAEDSLALYSVFEGFDAAAIRTRIDEAYRVLADPELREAYDQQHVDEEPGFQTVLHRDAAMEPGGGPEGQAGLDEPAREEGIFEEFDDAVEEYGAFEDEASGDFDGVRLRRARLFRGYEIDDISQVTKVSGAHLRNIEEENFKDLPADVYVRGFVTAYAQTIGLDPGIVVPSYMARLKESRSASSGSRFLSRG
jgi:curved DNA-binding protein CbpA